MTEELTQTDFLSSAPEPTKKPIPQDQKVPHKKLHPVTPKLPQPPVTTPRPKPGTEEFGKQLREQTKEKYDTPYLDR